MGNLGSRFCLVNVLRPHVSEDGDDGCPFQSLSSGVGNWTTEAYQCGPSELSGKQETRTGMM